jgi:SAM-dependent methyltransferase
VTERQREHQRSFYDHHYPRRAAAVREALAHPLFRSFHDRLARRLLELGAPGTDSGGPPLRVLEAGCGEGLLGSALQRVAVQRELPLAYTGTDISEAALELARESLSGDLVVGDATVVMARLPSASRDMVVAKNLLHHLKHPGELLRQASRVVGPAGRVMILEPRLGCPHVWVFNVAAFRRERYYFMGAGRNHAALRDAGLGLVHEERFSSLPYELAFVIRPSWFRRLFSTSDPRAIERVSRLDERLTETLPWLATYALWVAAPAGSGAAEPARGTNSV